MNEEAKTPRNIRIRPSVLHQARIAAVIQKKTLGQWLEEAIIEKVDREQNKVRRFKSECQKRTIQTYSANREVLAS